MNFIANLEQKKLLLSQIKANELAANAERSISSLLLIFNANLKIYSTRHEEVKKSQEDRVEKRHEKMISTAEAIPLYIEKSQEQVDREALRIENFNDEILNLARQANDSVNLSSKGYALLRQRVDLLNSIIAIESICDYVSYGHYLEESCSDLRVQQEYAKSDLEYLKDYGAHYHVYDLYAASNYKDDYIIDLFTERDNFDKDLETYSKLRERQELRE